MSKQSLRVIRAVIPTPVGVMTVVTDEQERVRALDWEDYESRMQRLWRLHYGAEGVDVVAGRMPDSVRGPLEAYLAGSVSALTAVLVETGGTEFQREVWCALRRIPAGTTSSYGELASAIGRPKAVRAVGLANGANPIGVIVPCHRVIGADGSLTGFGGGIERKRWLLEHEGVEFDDRDRAARERKAPKASGHSQRESTAAIRGVHG